MIALLRIRKAVLALLLVGVLMTMTAVGATAASSTQVVHWSGQADVVAVGVVEPGPSTFEYLRNGTIKQVVITTNQEVVQAADLEARCRRGEPAQEICDALNGSAILSVHSSIATLRRPQTIENPLSPLLPDVLRGLLTAELDAQFTSMGTAGSLWGVAPKIKAAGMGVYGCANVLALPNYPVAALPISACEDLNGDGMPDGMGPGVIPVMIPLGLAVVDTGRIEFTGGTGAFAAVTGGHAQVIVTVKADASGTSGKMTILGGLLRLGGGGD